MHPTDVYTSPEYNSTKFWFAEDQWQAWDFVQNDDESVASLQSQSMENQTGIC